jgi:type IX secretion system PorP/SprF family membrane protein
LRKLLIVILFLVFVWNVNGQDPQFSQFYANPLYLGPSFAGAVDGSRIAMSYRNQWWESSSPFRAYSCSYDHYFSTFNSGVGINVFSDVSGSSNLGSLNIGLHYSYNFKVFNVWHIRPGLAFYYVEHGLDGKLLFIDDIIHNSNYTGAPVQSSQHSRDIDFSSSALVYTKGFWIGSTVDHLLTPSISLYASESNIPIKWSIYGGYEFRRKGKLLKPSDETMTFAFIYKKQESIQQLDLGVYWHNYPLVLGLWYRGIPFVNSQRGDAMIFLVGIKTRSFNIGYSYDFTISNLLSSVRGSHEVSLSYKFLLPKRSKKGGVPCPEF